MHNTSKLNSDITSSNNDDSLRQFLEQEESIAIESKLRSFERRLSRLSSDSNEDSVGGKVSNFLGSSGRIRESGRNGNGVGVDESSSSSQIGDSVISDVYENDSSVLFR